MTEKTPVIDPVEEAKKLLQAEEKTKQEACSNELNEVLAKHGYELKAFASIGLIPKQS